MTSIENSDILFIINPNSGSKRYHHLIRRIKKSDPELTYIVTPKNETIKQVLEKNLEKYTVFIIVGGDGTVHDAARYLYNREDKILGVVPNGSGNGFAFELKFNRNIKFLLHDIHAGETINLDVLKINDIECINIAGLGFDSYVAHRFNMGKIRGFISYFFVTIKSLFEFKPFNASILIEKKEIVGRFQMICFANNKQFGNNAFIAPLAKPNDGVYDIVLVKPFPFYFYPVFTLRMFLGRLSESKYVKYIKTSEEITIKADSNEFHIDGEPFLFDGPINIKLGNKYLKVIRTKRNKL
ncbi:MAG: YegS/Rv2252/BmrU family lipid kinase [Porphyromonadaceae bacterium]|nr:MAG: YegS/Rv2252/BmrU family lipid kinase [Porphyromonadaceae bacterium]